MTPAGCASVRAAACAWCAVQVRELEAQNQEAHRCIAELQAHLEEAHKRSEQQVGPGAATGVGVGVGVVTQGICLHIPFPPDVHLG